MKRLYLLRHAQAASAQGTNDKERVLTPQGKADSKALGSMMVKKDYIPDLVLCSAATRTRQTLEGVSETLTDLNTEFREDFYNAPTGALFTGIQNVLDKYSSVLVIAHNPGIHDLALRMSASGGTNFLSRLATSYAPGSVSILNCEVEHWEDLSFDTNRLIDRQEPLDYNAPERPTRWM